jgi:hypothetical protein
MYRNISIYVRGKQDGDGGAAGGLSQTLSCNLVLDLGGAMEKSELVALVGKIFLGSVIPGGGALAELIAVALPNTTENSLRSAMESLQSQCDYFRDRIDYELVNHSEFAELFNTMVATAVRTHHEEKLQAAASVVCNSMLKPGDPAKQSYQELDHFGRCIDRLSIGAIYTLGACRQLSNQVAPGISKSFQVSTLRSQLNLECDWEMPFVESLLAELQSINLVELQRPPIRTQGGGESLVTLTAMGSRFISHIEGSAE